MSDDPQMRELQNVFIDEAKQSLAEAEETLMTLESNGFDIELVNKAFRLAHNFKGSARTVGFTELGRLAHKYEDVLTSIKKETLPLTPKLITALLKCNDTLRKELLETQADSSYVPSIDSDIDALTRAASNDGAHSNEPTSNVPHANETDWKAGFGFFDDEPKKPSITPATRNQNASKPATKPATSNPADETLKIPAQRLDALLNIIGELVVNQSILDEQRAKNETGSHMAVQAIGYMSKLISDIQSLSISLRLVPIKPLFQKLRRTARDVADSLGKQVNLIEEGDHCELDKGVIDRIADPLNHMIRNAMDHGVDTAEERQNLGKNPIATVRIAALTQDDQVKIIVSDDGRGLNKEKIIEKSIKNGLIQSSDSLTDAQIFSLIFAPGFSTKEQVTDVSGRGVGMEVVQKAVDDLKGSIRIESEIGKGTTFEISLPLSLSIIGGMVIEANGQSYIVPVSQLVETIELNKYSIETVTGTGRALNLRGEILPVYNLTNILLRKRGRPQANKIEKDTTTVSRPALVTHYRGKKVTFEVDRIVNQQKVVLKRLGKEFERLPGIVAGAVLSNGEPGLVLSLDQLVSGGDL